MKKIYIKENKLYLLKEFFGIYSNENQANADNVIVKDLNIHLTWDENGAYPFCWIDDELYIGDNATMHSSPALKAVYDDVNNKILNDGCNADIDGTFNDELDGYREYEFLYHPDDEEYREENETEEEQEDLYYEPYFNERNYLIGDWISYNHTERELNNMLEYMDISGRYWEYDKVISFWSSMTPDIMKKCIKELSERTKIDFSDYLYVYTDYDTDEFKYCTISEFINSNEEMEFRPDEREDKGIHLMNQKNKRNALADFRQNRAEVQGRKLGNMPMAQYHNLIYQEEKNVFNWNNYFSNLKRLDENINRRLLNESQESKSISAAKKLLMSRLKYNEQQADEFVRVKLRNDLPVLKTQEGGKFILGVTRMYLDGELNDANIIGNLNSTLKLVASDAHINEYDRNLNNISANDLINRFAKAISDNLNAEKEEINQMQFNDTSDYKIVKIDSFEQASEYGKYTSWCVTHYRNMFNSYTSEGMNQFYFCLKNDFEYIKPNKGENCPLDEYGLSMIAVSVDEKGMLNTCTCRWNHDNGGNDNIMDSKEISQVIDMNFFEVFKPNNKFKELVSNAVQRLNNGEDPREVFDECYSFVNGFSRVVLNKKENFINQNYELLSNQWFDNSYSFSNGFGIVISKGKWNYINQNGELLSPNQWFDECRKFKNGIANVRLNGKYNFIKQNGELLSPNQWFDGCDSFIYDFNFVQVILNNKYNFINKYGKLLSPNQWFDKCGYFKDGIVKVGINGQLNFINQNGELLSPNQWFDECSNFENGFASIKLNNQYNFINQNGELLSPNQWFDGCSYFKDGICPILLNGKINWIKETGELLYPNQLFDFTYNEKDEIGVVNINGQKCFINNDGHIIDDVNENTNKQKKIYINESQLDLLTE